MEFHLRRKQPKMYHSRQYLIVMNELIYDTKNITILLAHLTIFHSYLNEIR